MCLPPMWRANAKERKEMAIVFSFILLMLTSLALSMCCILNPFLWIPYALYILFITFIDLAPSTGGRPFRFMIHSSYWKYFSSYFRGSVLFQDNWHESNDKNQQYLFALHPHGVISLAVWSNIISNGAGLHTMLPNLNLRVITLPLNFKLPVWREFLLSMGMIDSHKQSIEAAFKKDCSVGIVVGGAKEALDAIPNSDYKLTLKARRGFIRVAMERGVPIVPVFSFGENDLYSQASHPLLRKGQLLLKKYVGFSTPLFIGQGFCFLPVGFLPHRKKITTVFGLPLKVPHNTNPTKNEINIVHRQYIKALQDLYEEFREKHAGNRELVLE